VASIALAGLQVKRTSARSAGLRSTMVRRARIVFAAAST